MEKRNSYIKKDNYIEFIIKDNKYNGVFYISAIDFEKVSAYCWHIKAPVNGVSYIEGKVNGQSIKLHRFILGITDQNIIIDHIDKNPLNNRRENLRISNFSENNRNIHFQKNNTSGRMGVSFRKMKNRPDRFVAKATFHGKEYTKMFSVEKYGYEKAFKLACLARENFEEKFNITSDKFNKCETTSRDDVDSSESKR